MKTLTTDPHIQIKEACERVFIRRYRIRDEDVIYNAMTSIIESYERVNDTIKNFEAWLIGAIHHAYCDYIFQKNRSKMFVNYDQVDDQWVRRELTESEYDLNLITSEINKLKPPYVEIVKKKLLEGKSHKEIAGEMQMNEATIRKYYSRSLPRLKERLKLITLIVFMMASFLIC
ncbi:sigma-70 family RNA polymerase sigma factor [Reichenbachiella sp.]|uniref:sigma-70 family RNA polymerase sigma factor n=1 Tax=Reichenbachiella sp. TaxID=2184521 RepID=UPI003298C2C3